MGSAGRGTIVLIPVYNDWHACTLLLAALDSAFAEAGRRATVLLVDDGSTVSDSALQAPRPTRALDGVDILRLKRNLGHQRAIGVGLAWIAEHRPCNSVVIMDADGEDDPRDVVRLLEYFETDGQRRIVFAERARRSEGLLFRFFYALYRMVHWLLTGRGVRVGNFSVVPFERLPALVTLPELWSHYAASVFISRIPYATVPTHRAKRLSGYSSMSFPSLVSHGLSAIAVFSEIVSVRVLLATLLGMAVTLMAMAAVAAVRLFTDLAVPGWATFTMGLLLLLLVQAAFFAVLFGFIVLGNRKGASVLLSRDYRLFVDRVVSVSAGATTTAGA